MTKRPVIFNLTRLMGRMHSPSPTGVDRLDIRYARFFLDAPGGRQPLFVHQLRNALSLVPLNSARQLIDGLWHKWVQPEDGADRNALLRDRGVHVRAWLRSAALGLISRQVDPGLVRALGKGPRPIFVNAGHTGVQHGAVHEQLRARLGADIVYYLHDLIPIDYPEYVRTLAYTELHTIRMACMARTGSLIIANSGYTRDRFLRFCAERKIAAPRCAVLEIGVEDAILAAAASGKRPLPVSVAGRLGGQVYFAAIGTIEPRKNHLLLLQVWRELARSMGEACPKLVLVGRRGWENENVVDMLERCPAVRRHVIELNGIGDHELIPIIQHARATMLLSFEEGWGIPVAESLALGTPVICSDIPALRECSRGRATFLHPLDGLGWLGAVRERSGTERASSVAMAQGVPPPAYAAPTWDAHYGRLGELLDEFDAV